MIRRSRRALLLFFGAALIAGFGGYIIFQRGSSEKADHSSALDRTVTNLFLDNATGPEAIAALEANAHVHIKADPAIWGTPLVRMPLRMEFGSVREALNAIVTLTKSWRDGFSYLIAYQADAGRIELDDGSQVTKHIYDIGDLVGRFEAAPPFAPENVPDEIRNNPPLHLWSRIHLDSGEGGKGEESRLLGTDYALVFAPDVRQMKMMDRDHHPEAASGDRDLPARDARQV